MEPDSSESYERPETEADAIEWYSQKPLGLWVCAYKAVGAGPTFIRSENPNYIVKWALARSKASIHGTEPPLEWICVTQMEQTQ